MGAAMSRRQTPHAKREKSRERRALDRAIVRCVRQMGYEIDGSAGTVRIHLFDQVELIGLKLARDKA
jgi:hypothetical protein